MQKKASDAKLLAAQIVVSTNTRAEHAGMANTETRQQRLCACTLPAPMGTVSPHPLFSVASAVLELKNATLMQCNLHSTSRVGAKSFESCSMIFPTNAPGTLANVYLTNAFRRSLALPYLSVSKSSVAQILHNLIIPSFLAPPLTPFPTPYPTHYPTPCSLAAAVCNLQLDLCSLL